MRYRLRTKASVLSNSMHCDSLCWFRVLVCAQVNRQLGGEMHKDDVDLRHVSPILDHPHPEDWADFFMFVSAEDGFLLPNFSNDVWYVEMSSRKWKMKWKPRHGVLLN